MFFKGIKKNFFSGFIFGFGLFVKIRALLQDCFFCNAGKLWIFRGLTYGFGFFG
jgi:hypothetical protein